MYLDNQVHFLYLFFVFVYTDKRPMEIDARMNMISCPDGRQLLMIMQTTKKDAGLYECVATNNDGTRYSAAANLYVRGRE